MKRFQNTVENFTFWSNQGTLFFSLQRRLNKKKETQNDGGGERNKETEVHHRERKRENPKISP